MADKPIKVEKSTEKPSSGSKYKAVDPTWYKQNLMNTTDNYDALSSGDSAQFDSSSKFFKHLLKKNLIVKE